MKKLVLLLFCVSAGAQINTAGEEIPTPVTLSNGKHLGLEITYIDEGEKNTYVFQYRNAEYMHIHDFRTVGFVASEDEIMNLYNEWDSLYDSMEEKRYEIGSAVVTAFPEKKVIYFFVDQPGETRSFFGLSRKNMAKAFGL